MDRKPGTAILIYDKVENPLQEAQTEGCKEMVSAYTRCSVMQAPAVMLTCMAEGISLREYARTYYTIENTSVMKSAAMIANFRTQFGGRHEIVERTPTCAHIKLFRGDEEYELKITAEETLRSRSPWISPKKAFGALQKLPEGLDFPSVIAAMREAGHLKDNWLTETDWRKMLWWRCVSEAVDAFCPEVDSGAASFADVEMMASDSDKSHHERSTSPTPAERAKSTMDRLKQANLDSPAASTVETVSVATNEKPPAEAPAETPVETPAETPAAAEDQVAKEFATEDQVAELESLFERLGTSLEIQNQIYARKNATTAHGLTRQEIAEAIDKLSEMARQKEAASEPANPT